MTLLLASVALALLVAVPVAAPILTRRAARLQDVVPGAVLDAEARKRAALASLKDVEYDFLAGKLDEADFREVRERLEREAVSALRAARGVGIASAPRTVRTVSAPPGIAAPCCGHANAAGSRFCGGCGKPLT
jgi:hypothetical protein